MSVLDQVRALEQQVLQRLRELRPLVAEYRDLEKVAQRLGLKQQVDDEALDAGAPEPTEPAAQSKPAAKRSAKRAAAARASKRAPAGRTRPEAARTAKPKAAAQQGAKAVAEAKPAAGSKRPARGSSPKLKPSARKRSAAARGQRERDVLRVVGERPGVTVRELATELGVDATGLYGVVRRLQGNGQLSKNGTQLRLSDAAAPAGAGAPDVAPEPSARAAATPPANSESSASPAAQVTEDTAAAGDST
jgi:hypothetical protein